MCVFVYGDAPCLNRLIYSWLCNLTTKKQCYLIYIIKAARAQSWESPFSSFPHPNRESVFQILWAAGVEPLFPLCFYSLLHSPAGRKTTRAGYAKQLWDWIQITNHRFVLYCINQGIQGVQSDACTFHNNPER